MKKAIGIFKKPVDFFILCEYNYLVSEIFVYKIYNYEIFGKKVNEI
ncbi:MarR family transcriptional family [Thermoanaerobacterium thermosaccharolyticum]|jgi:hypothetical protein|uniref:Uncharacterized protein n=3 Tax=Thermoanaerobacterium thermosaccharolyticum TaxID=1517 RepID=D9TM88_THETC|nr:hypothetical protein [Thermoanaerobacterium thermosaccharolyticum]ADL70060.1 hypothetical protein Tthe_2608 [Thermoanaerobacterium thermosaccharolyticum DSM 571]AGB20214.1 hypothetical protein Thethe_02649 [Thermoanaerobacterium thermosaccharolyticum M0795]AST57284.1 MarR family transcriptional family [Thermoanaerobacterium thermosaccharolyticum]